MYHSGVTATFRWAVNAQLNVFTVPTRLEVCRVATDISQTGSDKDKSEGLTDY